MTRYSALFASLLIVPFMAACSPSSDVPAVSDTPVPTAPSVATMTSMERGAKLWSRCRACHTLGQGERNKVGPNLWGVLGQPAGAREDFNYSRAMKASGIIWSEETLSAYLEKPNAYIPGNRMTYAGMRKPEDRAAVIEYLRAETTD